MSNMWERTKKRPQPPEEVVPPQGGAGTSTRDDPPKLPEGWTSYLIVFKCGKELTLSSKEDLHDEFKQAVSRGRYYVIMEEGEAGAKKKVLVTLNVTEVAAIMTVPAT